MLDGSQGFLPSKAERLNVWNNHVTWKRFRQSAALERLELFELLIFWRRTHVKRQIENCTDLLPRAASTACDGGARDEFFLRCRAQDQRRIARLRDRSRCHGALWSGKIGHLTG